MFNIFITILIIVALAVILFFATIYVIAYVQFKREQGGDIDINFVPVTPAPCIVEGGSADIHSQVIPDREKNEAVNKPEIYLYNNDYCLLDNWVMKNFSKEGLKSFEEFKLRDGEEAADDNLYSFTEWLVEAQVALVSIDDIETLDKLFEKYNEYIFDIYESRNLELIGDDENRYFRFSVYNLSTNSSSYFTTYKSAFKYAGKHNLMDWLIDDLDGIVPLFIDAGAA